jgi:hypothetical protein
MDYIPTPRGYHNSGQISVKKLRGGASWPCEVRPNPELYHAGRTEPGQCRLAFAVLCDLPSARIELIHSEEKDPIGLDSKTESESKCLSRILLHCDLGLNMYVLCEDQFKYGYLYLDLHAVIGRIVRLDEKKDFSSKFGSLQRVHLVRSKPKDSFNWSTYIPEKGLGYKLCDYEYPENLLMLCKAPPLPSLYSLSRLSVGERFLASINYRSLPPGPSRMYYMNMFHCSKVIYYFIWKVIVKTPPPRVVTITAKQ